MLSPNIGLDAKYWLFDTNYKAADLSMQRRSLISNFVI